jgi:hypothetical protein
METIKKYWKRFISPTPKDLKKLQMFLLAMQVPIGAAYGLLVERDMTDTFYSQILTHLSVALVIGIALLNFATTKKSLTDEKD